MGDNNTVLLFVLEYLGKVSISPEDEFESYEQLQVMAKKIRKRLIGNAGRGNVLLRCLDCASIEIEPEWKKDMKCLKWMFDTKTGERNLQPK